MRRTALFATISLLLVGVAPLAAGFFWGRSRGAAPLHLSPPAASLPWYSTSDEFYGWKPNFVASDVEFFQTYKSQAGTVKLCVAYYGPDRQDAKLVSSTNAQFDRESWSRMGEEEVALTLEGQTFQAHETLIRSARQSLVVWNWYWVDGTYTANEFLAKFLLAKSRFSRQSRGAAAIVVASEDLPGGQSAFELLKDFLNHISLQEILRRD